MLNLKIHFYRVIISTIFAGFILCSSHSVSATEGEVWLEASGTNVSENQDIVFEIHIDTGGKAIGSFDLIFNFNPQYAQVKTQIGVNGVVKGADMRGYRLMTNPNKLSQGQLKIGAMKPSNGASGADIIIAAVHMKTSRAFICKDSSFATGVYNMADTNGYALSAGPSRLVKISNENCPGSPWVLFLPAILSTSNKLPQ